MSHWRSGKLQLKCSLGLLKRALVSVIPEWKDHIYDSESGNLDLYDYRGGKKGDDYYLVVPGKGDPNRSPAPGFSYSGLGIKKQSDGTWAIDVDPAGLSRENSNIIGKVNAFVAVEKIKKIASQNGNKLVSSRMENGKRKILMTAPVSEKYKLHA